MVIFLRFRVLEIDSNVCFTGKKKRCLRYTVRSMALIIRPSVPDQQGRSLPEIFWQ